jgi:hypothetical protein
VVSTTMIHRGRVVSSDFDALMARSCLTTSSG